MATILPPAIPLRANSLPDAVDPDTPNPMTVRLETLVGCRRQCPDDDPALPPEVGLPYG